jgi:hypothetical protein
MDVVTFRQQLLRGRKTLGQKDEITVSVTPQWILDVLPYVYRAFPILQRSPTHPLGL